MLLRVELLQELGVVERVVELAAVVVVVVVMVVAGETEAEKEAIRGGGLFSWRVAWLGAVLATVAAAYKSEKTALSAGSPLFGLWALAAALAVTDMAGLFAVAGLGNADASG